MSSLLQSEVRQVTWLVSKNLMPFYQALIANMHYQDFGSKQNVNSV